MSSTSERASRLIGGLTLCLLVAVAGSSVTAAGQEGGAIAVVIRGGTLSGGTVTLDDGGRIAVRPHERAGTATWRIANVVDARGTGAGWHLTLTLTRLEPVDDPGESSRHGGPRSPRPVVPASWSLRIAGAPVASPAQPTSSPTSTITAIPADTPLSVGGTVTLLSASSDGGMGSYAFSPVVVELRVPPSGPLRTYQAAVGVSLNSGP